MKIQRKALFVKVITWLLAEVVLNFVGLDNLADYSEFLFEHELGIISTQPAITTTWFTDRCNVPSLFG